MKTLFLLNANPALSIIFGLLLISCGALNASPYDRENKCMELHIPNSLNGLDVVFQIENSTSGYPYKGVVVTRYKNGSFTAQGTGTMQGQVPDYQQAFYGSYKYQRTGINTAIEKSVDNSANRTSKKYTFETATSGRWEENFSSGQLKSSGSFTLVPSNLLESEHFAPSSIADTNVALIIKSTQSDLPPNLYPTAGLVLQTYAQDGTMVFKGFGPGTLNSHGTYAYKKVSANTAVEEVTQVSDTFTLPYTMVYTFDTAHSGKWFQNFSDGLIKFSGTFDIFPNQ